MALLVCLSDLIGAEWVVLSLLIPPVAVVS
jgi:hypothetical protein